MSNRSVPAPSPQRGPHRTDTTTLTVADIVTAGRPDILGYTVLDDLARQQREYRETIAARRAEYTTLHPFDLPTGRIISGGAM